MSLLTIIQRACDRLTIPRPTAVVASTDQATLNLLGLAQEEGKELSARAAWQAITTEKTFTTVAAALQTSAVPADFDWYIPETMFNRTSRRQVYGPLSQHEWQQIQASLTTLVNPAFRFRGNNILISPTPTAGQTVAYEYVSKNWCESSGGTDQPSWAADTDVGLLDEELMVLGVIWRFRKSKGLDYAEEFRTYENRVNLAMTRDGAKPRIDTTAVTYDRVTHSPQVPDTLVGLA